MKHRVRYRGVYAGRAELPDALAAYRARVRVELIDARPHDHRAALEVELGDLPEEHAH